ncbi:MAG: MBL fold metallo-hydrolase [Pseudomonadota bacterium]
MTTKITFHGAAGTVTGSCYRVEHGQGSFIIDCGLFQGNKTIRALNYEPFPFDPSKVDYMLLTHAHIDHAGLIPKLYANGFRGALHATAPSIDLLSFMLPDSAHIQESEVERLNRRRRRSGEDPLEPIYTRRDADRALRHAEGHDRDVWFEPGPGVRARYWNAGHILGSASIEVEIDDADGDRPLRLLFSGDLGPDEKVFHLAPDAPAGFDYILCESTYGDREREDATVEERRAALKREIRDAMKAGGNLVIPSFAVERSQELLHDIGVLMAQGEIRERPVFLDSPLAHNVTNVFIKHAHTLDDIDIDEEDLFRDPNFRLVESVDESKSINRIKSGAIIMAASGMCEAGRIKHHLLNNIWRENATILFVGFQAPGTLGALIRDGEEEVRIHGKTLKVRARIRSIGNYSAHADQSELLGWIEERLPAHGGIFLTHGDDDAREVLGTLIDEKTGGKTKVWKPTLGQSFTLTPSKAALTDEKPPVSHDDMIRDWDNDYAAFTLALERKLKVLRDPDQKRALITRLKAVLNG